MSYTIRTSSIKLRFQQNEAFVCLFCFYELLTSNVLRKTLHADHQIERLMLYEVMRHYSATENQDFIDFILLPFLSSLVLLHLTATHLASIFLPFKSSFSL